MSDDDIRRLADLAGILPRYHDLSGTGHETPMETFRALLAAMRLDPDAAADIAHGMDAARAERALPVTAVVAAGEPAALWGTGPVGDWHVTLEDGTDVGGHAEHELHLPPLPMGYHRLVAGGHETLLIAAPRQAPSAVDLTGRHRIWGVTGAIYALRSARNHGVGDFADLAAVGETWAAEGADFIGINPLHALGAATGVYSPYSPSHRGLLNPRHIALDAIPDFPFQAGSGTENDGDIDYERAAQQSNTALTRAFEGGGFDSHMDEVAAFRTARGAALERFCLFEAISLRHGPDPNQWPDDLKQADAPGVAAFAAAHAREVDYHVYLQWLADRQLSATQARLTDAGMALGLYMDLAVGVRHDGAEPWARPDIFARGASLGVPPDAFNPAGQEWGLAPINPQGLAAAGFRPLIETLRAAMRHAGMIRVDHAIGLMRCFWVPDGGLPGAYVRYPLDVLLAIIRLEATRQGCLVIGEDLGVVPDGLRHELYESGLYGVSVMQFEREGEDASYRKPEHYPVRGLASFGTHDTPTFAGYWKGVDIEERLRLGQLDETEAGWARDGRAWDRHQLLVALRDAGLLPDGADPDQPQADADLPLGIAMHSLLAGTASELCAVQIDDALLSARQPNFPGTTTEYPNWRVPMACTVEDLADRPGVKAVAAVMNSQRPKHERREA